MKMNMEYAGADSGWLTFYEESKLWLRMRFEAVGEEEAELTIEDRSGLLAEADGDTVSKETLRKAEECVVRSFQRLWDEGYEETVLWANRQSDDAVLLNRMTVVESVYSEYMMGKQVVSGQEEMVAGTEEFALCRTVPEEVRCCEALVLCRTEQEGIRFYEAEDGSFCCKLNSYRDGWYLYEVAVKEELRNQGIATGCLRKLLAELAEDGDTRVYLQVGSYNAPAVHLYRKLGFEITEEICYYALTEEAEELL